MQGGTDLPAVASISNVLTDNGTVFYPGTDNRLVVPANTTVFLNITGTDCRPQGNAANPLPKATVLKKHYYFGYRPSRTWLYGEFDTRDWAAHLGMGNETNGFSIAGEHTSRSSALDAVTLLADMQLPMVASGINNV